MCAVSSFSIAIVAIFVLMSNLLADYHDVFSLSDEWGEIDLASWIQGWHWRCSLKEANSYSYRRNQCIHSLTRSSKTSGGAAEENVIKPSKSLWANTACCS